MPVPEPYIQYSAGSCECCDTGECGCVCQLCCFSPNTKAKGSFSIGGRVGPGSGDPAWDAFVDCIRDKLLLLNDREIQWYFCDTSGTFWRGDLEQDLLLDTVTGGLYLGTCIDPAGYVWEMIGDVVIQCTPTGYFLGFYAVFRIKPPGSDTFGPWAELPIQLNQHEITEETGNCCDRDFTGQILLSDPADTIDTLYYGTWTISFLNNTCCRDYTPQGVITNSCRKNSEAPCDGKCPSKNPLL